MIKLLTDSKWGKYKDILIDINTNFECVIWEVPNFNVFLTEMDLFYLNEIDKVKKVEGQYMETEYCGTHIGCLSTGSKTIIMASYLDWKKDNNTILSLDGSGANVLALIFTDDRYKDNTFFLTHRCFPDIETNEFIVENYPNKVFHSLKDFRKYDLSIIKKELEEDRSRES